jgi:hypothetical protein
MEEMKLKALELRLISYQENEQYDDTKFSKTEEKKTGQQVSIGMSINSEDKSAFVEVTTTCTHQQGDIIEECFVAKTRQDYIIENFDKVILKNEEGHIIVGKEICNHLTAMTIAESRGIIASIPKREAFRKMNIPIFEWKKMFNKGINIEEETDPNEQ